MPKRIVKLLEIDLVGSPMVRSMLNSDVVNEYTARYLTKAHGMPDPVLFEMGGVLLIGDGMHRIQAMFDAGLESQTFEVIPGSREECIKFALGSNMAHGLRRSNADKRAAVTLALMEFTKLSNGALADMCGVGDDLVASVRAGLEIKRSIPAVSERTSADGRTFKQSTTKVEQPKEPVEDKSKVAEVPRVQAAPDTLEAFDSTGYPIPKKARPVWGRKIEALDLARSIDTIKAVLARALNAQDLLFVELNFKSIEADLDRVSDALSVVVPYAVCPACQGQNVETCNFCNGRGCVSRHRYRTAPEDIRSIREQTKT